MIGSRSVAFIALFVSCGAAQATFGDEICPGCYGKGRVGCGRCSSAVLGTFVGKCPTCSGFFSHSLRPGENCPTCRGTQVCVGCNGQGATCLVCKGSGRVPDGFAQAVAAERTRKQSAGIDRQIKQKLQFLEGRWNGEGEDASLGRFHSEMRWTSVLDGSYLRHEERVDYATGAVSEIISYLTWEESDQKYLWAILFAPGKGVLARGVPSRDGGKIAWDIILDNGGVLKMTWSLDAVQNRLDIDSILDSRSIGTSRFQRTGPIGSAIVTATSNPKRVDSKNDAVLQSLQPLSVLIGTWKGVGSNEKGPLKTQSRWNAVLSGTVYETESSTSYADGTVARSVGALSFDPNERKIVYMHLAPLGVMSVFKGDLKPGSPARATINVNGATVVWNFTHDGRTLEWFVGVPDDSGRPRTIEQGIDVKE